MLGDAAAAGGAAVDGDELAEHVAVADHQPRRLAAELQVLRHQADRGEREDLVAVADARCGRRSTADAPIRQSRPIRTCAPIDRVRADHRAGADHGARVDDGRRMDRDAGSPAARRHERHHQLGFGGDLVADVRRGAARARARARRGPSVTSSRSRSPGTTWQPELGVVDAAQVDAPRSAAPSSPCISSMRRHLRQRLDHQHARHQRRAGKMPLEEFFVDGDVLDRDEARPGSCSVIASTSGDG